MISLDNDLGEGDVGEGRNVAAWLEEAAYFYSIPPVCINIHTSNPVARTYMLQCRDMAYEYWLGLSQGDD